MHRAPLYLFAWMTVLLCSAASAQAPAPTAAPKASAVGQCLPAQAAFLVATLRGAVNTNLNWHSDELQCDGSIRPDGTGLRISVAGPLPAAADGTPRRLRFVFGIDTAANGPALPTNLTVIIEGEGLLFATRGDARCTTDRLQRDAGGINGRLEVRGFCTGPALTLDGNQRLLVSTFDFSARLSQE